MKNKPLYICYSVPQMNFLTEKGSRYELVALNKNTGSTMWVYMRTNELDKHLSEWSLGKN